MTELTHLSLFSGIGGLDLAAEWAGFKTVGQCEWADYPMAVLEKHWPNVPKWRDVHDLTADDFFRRTRCPPGGVTCISGGFPCQPHSTAGLRKASGDERDLWPEMRRVISEVKPRWVVAENVRGLLSSENGRFFLRVLRDFADMGYDVGWGVTSAAAAGAIHRRERVAIVAHSTSKRCQGGLCTEGRFTEYGESQRAFANLLQKADSDYLSESAICGIHDGIRERLGEIKAYGNAVCPQQFYPIFKAIAEVEVAG